MKWKQHRGFKSKLLAVLFLFFNCVCIAAPVAKFSNDNFKDAILIRTGSPLQSEEETHLASGYINHAVHYSFHKKFCKKNHHFFSTQHSDLISGIESNTFFDDGRTLPLPGNYTFLFRYNLF